MAIMTYLEEYMGKYYCKRQQRQYNSGWHSHRNEARPFGIYAR
jgi:hypothetical protein